jgi:hypothetical protein
MLPQPRRLYVGAAKADSQWQADALAVVVLPVDSSSCDDPDALLAVIRYRTTRLAGGPHKDARFAPLVRRGK